MDKKYITGQMKRENGELYTFACSKFSDIPYCLERIKYVRANGKQSAIKAREKYENLILILPLAPKARQPALIAELTRIKLKHDIYG